VGATIRTGTLEARLILERIQGLANLLMLLGAELTLFIGLILFAWLYGQIGRNIVQAMRFIALSIGLTNAALIVSAI